MSDEAEEETAMCRSCCCSVTKSCLTLHDPMNRSTSSFRVPHHLLEFAQVNVHWVSDAIQPSHPLLSPSLSAFNLSQQQSLFQWVVSWHQVAKVLELQLQQQSFQWNGRVEYSGLTSFRIEWLDLLAVQGTLKSLLQHRSSKASVPWCLAFFIFQLSHSYMTTWKTIALTRWTIAGKVMSLLFTVSTVAQWWTICLQWRKPKFNPWIGKIP